MESRSLLAAGVFDYTLDPGDAAAEQLPADIQQTNTQRDSDRQISFARNISQSLTEPAQNQPTHIANELVANERLVNPLFSTPTPALSPTTLQSQVSQRPDGVVDVAIAALVSEPTTDVNADSELDFLTEEVSTVDAESFSRIVVKDTLIVNENTLRPTFGDIGFIDLAPSDPLEPLTDDSEPWQLDRRILPSLNRIADRVIGRPPLGDRADVIDRLMQDWISGPGGLIALEQFNLPASLFPHPPERLSKLSR